MVLKGKQCKVRYKEEAVFIDNIEGVAKLKKFGKKPEITVEVSGSRSRHGKQMENRPKIVLF